MSKTVGLDVSEEKGCYALTETRSPIASGFPPVQGPVLNKCQ